jgi:predicted RNA-binding Zn-ribbon protein involved in translation (DUF1610 family)
MSDRLRCPSCGQVIDRGDARRQGREDEVAALTCPTCGAGIGDDDELLHDPVIGP